MEPTLTLTLGLADMLVLKAIVGGTDATDAAKRIYQALKSTVNEGAIRDVRAKIAEHESGLRELNRQLLSLV